VRTRRFAILSLLPLALGGCQSLSPTPAEAVPAQTPPIRFLLTFDDGPSIRTDFNPTLAIQNQLARNDIEPGIKAIFFVQTRNANGGGTPAGKAILRRAYAAGHVIGLHSGTARGHIRHTKMAPQELARMLDDGKADIRAITGHDPEFIRPTFWGYSDATRAAYEAHHLKMLLTNINGHDGTIYVFDFKLNARHDFDKELLKLRAAIDRGALPPLHGVTPVVVTMHDVNRYTAHHLTEYLHILVDESRRVGLPLSDRPFYNDTEAVIEAATLRTVPAPTTIVAAPLPARSAIPATAPATN
jgi:peptidoglycan/xylan/chitin deacetylase (PgdA/CDA1 family)